MVEIEHPPSHGVDPELLKEVRRLQIRSDRLVEDFMVGGWHSVFRGSGIEFDEVREWVEGDDIRSVDWNVTARVGRPYVKKYVEERERTLCFLLDRSPAMSFGTRAANGKVRTLRRTAAELCACLGLSAQRNADKVGFLGFGSGRDPYIPPKKGRPHLLRILRECLAEPGRGPSDERSRGDFAEALRFLTRVQRRRSILFAISDFSRPLPVHECRLAARKHDLILVPVHDPVQEEAPRAGLLALKGYGGGEGGWVDFSSRRVREVWNRRFKERREAFFLEARRVGADLLPLRTDRSVAQDILAFFERREGRR